MKHLKTYESIYSTEVKDIYNIEDSLVRFMDTGEIFDLNVSTVGTGIIRIFFSFDESIIGMKKLILLDKIISVLKRKHKYITISENRLFVDAEAKYGFTYIDYSLVDHINKMLGDKLNGLNTYISHNYKYFGKYKDDIILKYDESHKALFIDKERFFSLFENKFMLSDKDISSIIQYAVVNTLKIEVLVMFMTRIIMNNTKKLAILNTPKIEPI